MINPRLSLPTPEGSTVKPLPRAVPVRADGYSLEQVVAILRRRLRLIVFVAVAGTGVALAAAHLLTPLYQATSVVSVDQGESPVADVTDGQAARTSVNTAVNTQIELITSRPLLIQVINELHLSNDALVNPPIAEVHLPEPWQTILAKLPAALLLKTGLATEVVPAIEAPEADDPRPAQDLVADAIIDRLRPLL